MTVVDVHNSRFHRIYTDKDSISLIMDRDVIYVYELATCQPSEEMIHVSIYHREEKSVEIWDDDVMCYDVVILQGS